MNFKFIPLFQATTRLGFTSFPNHLGCEMWIGISTKLTPNPRALLFCEGLLHVPKVPTSKYTHVIAGDLAFDLCLGSSSFLRSWWISPELLRIHFHTSPLRCCHLCLSLHFQELPHYCVVVFSSLSIVQKSSNLLNLKKQKVLKTISLYSTSSFRNNLSLSFGWQ